MQRAQLRGEVGCGAAEHGARVPLAHVLSTTSVSDLESLNFALHLEMKRPSSGPCDRGLLGEIRLLSHQGSLPGPAPGVFAHTQREAPSNIPPTQTMSENHAIHSLCLKPRLASDVIPLTPRWGDILTLLGSLVGSFKKMEV